ncbi:hypothetical protein PR048_000561 [Dryococelus australis]|uniref:TTF-type domain-containing protein n=1 Tax=Dryococelus australis TaxID=614101 RepID=A0ABQ9IFX6_9NEOP|nr:hypothetical protein PR048_000561 [Dryococelus australis]
MPLLTFRLALSASLASASSQSQTSVASCDKLPGKSKGRTFQKSWKTSFSWLEWVESSDKVFCKTCKKAEANGFLKFITKKDDTFISVGFSNWKKALEKFRSHETTETHKDGLMKLASSSKQSVAIQLNDQSNKDMENARSALMTIFTTLRFLCQQGLSIRGHKTYKWLSHDIQNEIIDILGKSVLRSVVCEMKKREHFAIMVDETCDISIHAQVTCIRSVDENLTISEDFARLYETPNTEGKTRPKHREFAGTML